MTHYVAIDIGGTNIKYGLIDQEGQLVESHEMPTEAHKGGPHILQKTKDIVASYLEKGPVAGVAISSAGMVDPDKGEIFYAGPSDSQLCRNPVQEGNRDEFCDSL